MKTILLAGGKGTRLSEETAVCPKPLVEVGGRPILWHLMQVYAHHGYTSFVVACGYKGELIKRYFAQYHLHWNDFTVNLATGVRDDLGSRAPSWTVTVVDTGQETLTGGRVQRLQSHVANETFMVTYGDGLGDIDLGALVAFHRAHGKLATVTAVHPPARFGELSLDGDRVAEFVEKPQTRADWINGGFFVFEPGVFDYLQGDTALEREPLERLARDGQLMAFRHEGFWHPMDTLRDRRLLEGLWASGQAPWRVWT